MNRVMTVVVLTGMLLLGTRAIADDAVPSKMSKRQIVAQVVNCMKMRMSADRSISYYEAMKACKDQVNRQNDTPAAGALVASDHPAKP
jgi:hypothetical protein